MTEITIRKTSELFNGGCNACPNVVTDFYYVELNNVIQPLETLTTYDVVGMVALANGYTCTQEYDAMDDYDVYTKDGYQVNVYETYNQYEYQAAGQKRQVKRMPENPAAVCQTATEILQDFFQIKDCQFIFDDGI